MFVKDKKKICRPVGMVRFGRSALEKLDFRLVLKRAFGEMFFSMIASVVGITGSIGL